MTRTTPTNALVSDVLFLRDRTFGLGRPTVGWDMQMWLTPYASFGTAFRECPRADWLLTLAGIALLQEGEVSREGRQRLTKAGLALLGAVLKKVPASVRREYRTGATFPRLPRAAKLVEVLTQFATGSAPVSTATLQDLGRAAHALEEAYVRVVARLPMHPRRDEHILRGVGRLIAGISGVAERTYLPTPGQGTELLASHYLQDPAALAMLASAVLDVHPIQDYEKYDRLQYRFETLVRPAFRGAQKELGRLFARRVEVERRNRAVR